MFLCNILCLVSDSTKTIRLLALDFYEVIVGSGFALINYHLIEISSSYNLIVNYYMDKGILLATKTLVESIRHYIRDPVIFRMSRSRVVYR